jgi:hypothetical protein
MNPIAFFIVVGATLTVVTAVTTRKKRPTWRSIATWVRKGLDRKPPQKESNEKDSE